MKILRSNEIVEIVFDELASKNSFSLDHAQQWAQEVTTKPTQIMLLRSEGSVFCSGGPLKDYAKLTNKFEGVALNQKIREQLDLIAKVNCLKMAFVTGDCFGGGIEVLSVCDKIYSLNHVFFGMWQSRMHLSFGWGGYARLAQRMNPAELRLWLSEGSTHSAFWCYNKGLVDEILALDVMVEKFHSLKTSCMGQRARYFSTDLAKDESQFFSDLWWSPEHRQALSKFKPLVDK